MGDHDFTSFSKKDSEKNNKFCSVFDIKWRRKKRGLIFKIEANRFLHGMVRTIVGSVLHAVKSNYSNEYIPDVLSRLDRKAAAEAVPAKGLFLYRVEY
jgi:tRNA pseudouridine38-40 synthase